VVEHIEAGALDVAFEDAGPANGRPVVLLHGFPYDAHCYDEVVPLLVAAGRRVIVPYLRGYGPTTFLSVETPRSGQQAALAHDLLALIEALDLDRAVLGGFDWGGRAACIVSALWPERVRGLVTGGGYNVLDVAGSSRPQAPLVEHALWYQYYFHTERGCAGLAQYRHDFCKLLWGLWSPQWRFDDATYAQTAASFDNPDFVDVVIHSYRHRFALVPGDPAVEETEQQLSERPTIGVPTIALHGGDNGVSPVTTPERNRHLFTGAFDRFVLPGVGHNVPQEAPREFAEAILSLR
jgi:pimeloyl-ACP methyl ester carboxylesterase